MEQQREPVVLIGKDIGKKKIFGLPFRIFKKAKVRFFWVIRFDIVPVVTIELLAEDIKSTGRIILQTRSYADVVFPYRLMKILEKFSEINIEKLPLILSVFPEWKELGAENKKSTANFLGLKDTEIEKIMAEVPADLEKFILTLQKSKVEIDTASLQKEVLAGTVKISPALKKLGIKSFDEIEEERNRIVETIKPYQKYINAYFKERGIRFCENSSFGKILEKSICRVFSSAEMDFALGFSLLNLDKLIMEDAISLFSADYPDLDAMMVREIEIEDNALKTEEIISFLMRHFPEKGRSREDYKREIFRLMAEYEKNNIKD